MKTCALALVALVLAVVVAGCDPVKVDCRLCLANQASATPEAAVAQFKEECAIDPETVRGEEGWIYYSTRDGKKWRREYILIGERYSYGDPETPPEEAASGE